MPGRVKLGALWPFKLDILGEFRLNLSTFENFAFCPTVLKAKFSPGNYKLTSPGQAKNRSSTFAQENVKFDLWQSSLIDLELI